MSTTAPEESGELRERIRAILHRDSVWAAYALADLQPAFDPYCRWQLADSPEGPGLTLLYTGLSIPTLVTVGAPAAVAQALTATPLPDQVYLTVREEHEPIVATHYDLDQDRRPMWRMVWDGSEGPAPSRKERARVQRLGPADAQALQRLYAQGGPFAPDAFDPYQLDNGLFYGVWDGEARDGSKELAAAGGTHIVNRAEQVAAIGNVYTRPDRRRQGLARAITQALLAGLQAANIRLVVLNVDQRNQPARTLYEALGFRVHCPYVEGVAVRHAV